MNIMDQIRNCQIQLDEADPYLIEALHAKSDEELQIFAERENKMIEIEHRLKKPTTSANDRLNTVLCLMEFRRLKKVFKDLMENDNDPTKGVSLR